MNRTSRKAAVLFTAVLLQAALVSGDERDDSRFELRMAKELAYRGGKVSVEHQFGGVTIRGGGEGTVSVRAFIRSSDPEFGKQIRVEAASTAGGVTIATVYPSGRWSRNRDFSYSVDYEIVVPRSAPVHVSNRFGSINATGIAPSSEIENRHGSVRVTDARGPQNVQNQFGSIDVSNIAGDVVVRNANGSIRAEEIRGKADLTNRFGSVVLVNAGSSATVRNSNGSVQVRGVNGAATVDNSFGSIKVEDVRGNLGVDASHSQIDVRGVSGDASVKTTFSSANVSRVRGAIDVQNQNGAISVSGASVCQPISLRTSFSTIRVGVPANASYAVNARTSFGRISSDLPITTRTLSGETAVGTIGGGRCRMDLVNNNGSITIRKE